MVGVSGTAERSSLVLGCDNSTRPDAAETDGLRQSDLGEFVDRDENQRYDCRVTYRNFRHVNEEGGEAPFRCGSWECYCCGYRMRQNLIEEIGRVCAQRPEMRRMLTLTLDPSKAPADDDEKHRYLTERWNALRTALSRRYNGSISYIWVREEGEKSEDAHPHLHAIVDRYIPQAWLSATWSELGGGEIVDIRYLDRVDQAAHYLGKYLTKNALSGLPDGIHRYGSSSDLELDVRGGGDDDDRDWALVMDDYQTAPVASEGPLVRGVAPVDFIEQRRHGGPLGVPPPD